MHVALILPTGASSSLPVVGCRHYYDIRTCYLEEFLGTRMLYLFNTACYDRIVSMRCRSSSICFLNYYLVFLAGESRSFLMWH
jgi:hypothetical protein